MSFQDLEAGNGPGLHRGRQQDQTYALAAGIFQVNTAVSTFNRLVNTIGTPKDSPQLREKMLVLN